MDEAIQWAAVLRSRCGSSSGFPEKLEYDLAQADSYRFV